MHIRTFVMAVVLGFSGISAVMAQSSPTAAPTARQNDFPPVGLAFGENMQVNLLNQAANAAGGTAASCTGTVSFLDATGKVIDKTGGPFTVAAGQIQAITLHGTDVNASMGSRAEIRVQVSLTITRGTPCSLAESLETFDSSTGATHVYQTATAGGPIPFLLNVIGRD